MEEAEVEEPAPDQTGMDVEPQNTECQEEKIEEIRRKIKNWETALEDLKGPADMQLATSLLKKVRLSKEAIERMEEPAEEEQVDASSDWKKANDNHKKASSKAEKARAAHEASTKELEAIQQSLLNAQCKVETDAQLYAEAKAALSLAAKEVAACNAPPQEKETGHDLDFNEEEEEDERALEIQRLQQQMQQQAQFMEQMHQRMQQQTLDLQKHQTFMAAVKETAPERAAELQAFIEQKYEAPAPLPPPPPQAETARGTGKSKTAAGGKGGKKTVQSKFLKANSTTPLPSEAATAKAKAEELNDENHE
jgi:hypothetical protein